MFLAIGTAVLVRLLATSVEPVRTQLLPSPPFERLDIDQNQDDAKSLYVCSRPRMCAYGRLFHPPTLFPLRLLRDRKFVHAGEKQYFRVPQ